MRKKLNLLEEKKAQLQHLTSESMCAYSIFSDTIARLKDLNEEIAQREDEIYQIEQEMQKTRIELTSQKERNAKLVQKLTNLLED